MNDDELRNRIAAADPAPASVEPVRSASAQQLLEAIMTTDLDAPATAPTPGGDQARPRQPRRNRWTIAALGAAAVAALVIGGAALGGAFDGDDEPDVAVEEPPAEGLPVDETPDDTPADGGAVLELTAPGADLSMGSCIRPDATVAGMSETAFLGTVTAIDGELVTLEVDRWYVGGEAPVVTVFAPDGLEALIGSVDFVVGEQFVISAYGDTVAYCELSGPATPERLGWYEEAFGA